MQNHNIRKTWDFFTWKTTNVNVDSALGQPVLSVADPTQFAAGQAVVIDPDASGGGLENKVILSVGASAITLTTNLANNHTAAQNDKVIRQGQYQDVQQGGNVDDLQAEVWSCIRKSINVLIASVTDGNGFTLTMTGTVNGQETVFHTFDADLASENGEYTVYLEVHYDDIKVEISAWVDGDLNVKGAGRVG